VYNSCHETRRCKKNLSQQPNQQSTAPQGRPRPRGSSSNSLSVATEGGSGKSVTPQDLFLKQKRLLVDANVIVAAYLPAAVVDVADKPLRLDAQRCALFLRRCTERKISLVAPHSLLHEVFSGYWDYYAAKILSLQDISEILHRIGKRQFQIKTPDLQRGLEIAVQLKRTKKPHDALYVALAETLNLRFVTNDKRLVNGVRQQGIAVELATPEELFPLTQ
jgi:predicted nucleic acid-binding protein